MPPEWGRSSSTENSGARIVVSSMGKLKAAFSTELIAIVAFQDSVESAGSQTVRKFGDQQSLRESSLLPESEEEN